MMESEINSHPSILYEDSEDVIDPIHDIIDYLVRCANVSFKNSNIGEAEVRTTDKIEIAYKLYKKSPTLFLIQFGKYLSPNHLPYFENLHDENSKNPAFIECVKYLKAYHSDRSRHKRIRNRRYRALQKMQEETDYFSERQMMFRNPLLYDQLIGQYLDDEEILRRDAEDSKDLTFLNIILSTVDMNEMNEIKHRQMLEESLEFGEKKKQNENFEKNFQSNKKMWGDFDEPDSRPTPKFETRNEATISSHERAILREEFFQEMFSSFLEGRDEDIDYNSIDNNEQYDDLQQISQDAEDKYFDSELNDMDNLEEHMKLVEEYGRKISKGTSNDPLDIFMKHIESKIN